MANKKRNTQKSPTTKKQSTTKRVVKLAEKPYKKIALYVIPIIIIFAVLIIIMVMNPKNSYTDAFKYQMSPPQKGDTVALMKTNLGDIRIKFFPKEAPKAVENFTKHAKDGYYNGLTFHRVMEDFMIQGGDPLGTGTGGESIWKTPFEDEFSDNLHNFRGALSMANSGPNTNGSQFFIVQKKNMQDGNLNPSTMDKDLYNLYLENGGTQWLDGKHTVFGQVYQGMDIVDKIATVKAQNTKPVEPVKMNKVEITQYE